VSKRISKEKEKVVVYDTKHQVDETERDYWVVLGDFNEDFIRDKKEEPT